MKDGFKVKKGIKVFSLLVLGMLLFYITQLVFKDIEPFRVRYLISIFVFASYGIGLILGTFAKIK